MGGDRGRRSEVSRSKPGSGKDAARKPPRWRKRADSHWAINTTVRCQHRCVYCFEGRRPGLTDIPVEETKKLIDRAAAEVSAVIFMGAEPTLNPALAELIRYSAGLGLVPSISTNALRLADPAYLRSLHDAGLAAIELSFPYPDESVYSRITQAKPAGFGRLLTALGNIESLNRGLPSRERHHVFVNFVVSRFNVGRLEEVLGRLRGILSAGSYTVTMKRVTPPTGIDEEMFRRDIYVPCAELRQALTRLAASADAGVRLVFRDFPLCAIPGSEHLDGELGFHLNEVRVRQNFRRQDRDADMYPEELRRAPHPFDWICDACSLAPVCLTRGLFLQASNSPEHAPIAELGPVPPRLKAWVRRQAKGDAVWTSPRKVSALGRVLKVLAAAAPPGVPLAGTRLRWGPLERGELSVSDGKRTAGFRIQVRRDGAGPGSLHLEPVGGPASWAAPGVAVLEQALRSLTARP